MWTHTINRQNNDWSKKPAYRTKTHCSDDDVKLPLSFRDDTMVFLRNITLPCYRWLMEPNQSGWEVLMWLVVHLVGVVSIVFIMINAYEQYTVNPLVTSLYNTLYPIKEVPWPAVSVCNNNRMSRQAAIEYATLLASSDSNNSEVSYHLDNIRAMGQLFEFDYEMESDLSGYQSFLNEFHDLGNGENFDTTKLMKKLSPQCADMLIKCIWRGVERPCMVPYEMMEMRSTQYGYCCTFNYVRPDSLQEEELPSYYNDDIGPDLGLILLINGSSSDYFYPLYNIVGFIVQIFNPNEFPDVPSGSVSEKMVELGYETFIRIDSSTLVTDAETMRYSSTTRGCLFPEELKEEFGGRYKRSDCVVNCRVASIVALCNCLVFFLPLTNTARLDDGSTQIPKCTLEHVPCLNRYRIKWSTMLMSLEKVIGLERELGDGLYCPQCLPSCSDTIYSVSSDKLPLIPTARHYPNILTGIENVSDLALVRIFLGQRETWLYRQVIDTKWFEIISNLGGLCGVISGFSLISVAEILYFVVRQMLTRMLCTGRKQSDHTGGDAHGDTANENMVLNILP